MPTILHVSFYMVLGPHTLRYFLVEPCLQPLNISLKTGRVLFYTTTIFKSLLHTLKEMLRAIYDTYKVV